MLLGGGGGGDVGRMGWKSCAHLALAVIFAILSGAIGMNLGSDYSQAVADLKLSAPSCLQQLRYPEFVLPDGSLRTTFARESVEQPTAVYPPCLSETSDVISRHFDSVFASVANLLENLTEKESLRWKSANGESAQPFSDLPIKEHIHVYHGGVKSEEGFATPFHTDNGILLLITPFQQHPLQIKSVGGKIIDTSSLDDSSVLILLARALPEWLLRGTRESKEFRPAPHAVQSLATNIKDRTVFARMMVAPLDAVPASSYAAPVPFRKIFFNQPTSQDCLTSEEHLDLVQNSRVPRETMEGHAGHAMKMDHSKHNNNRTEKAYKDLKDDECSDPTTAYCWMGCLALPDSCPNPDQYVCTNSADKNCCTDPADEGTGKCADMDPTCTWKCSDKPDVSSRFCIPGSGTDMYMAGFEISGQPDNACVILFIKAWTLDTRVKFLFGCLGCIVLGIFVEGLLCFRRLIQSRKILRIMSSPVRRGCIIGLFGFNIAFGYLAMLVAMTYSVELFICMVIGLVLGHAIFNTSAPVGESVDPCCASQVIGQANHSQGSDSSHM